jgi:hypothetical protein
MRSLHRCRVAVYSWRCRSRPHPGLPARSDSRRAQHRSSPEPRRCNRSPRRCTAEARIGPRAGMSRPRLGSPRRPGSRPAPRRNCLAPHRCSRIPGRCRAPGRIAPLVHRYQRHRGSVAHPDNRPIPRRSCPAPHRCTHSPVPYRADYTQPGSGRYPVHQACWSCHSKSVRRHRAPGFRSCSRSLPRCRGERAHPRIGRCHCSSWSSSLGRHRPLRSWDHRRRHSQHTGSGSRPLASGTRQDHPAHHWSGSR